MLSRNASISPDAVYFNPAGLMLMDNGFYISVQSQSLFQTKSVQSGFPLLNTGKFDGTLTAPIFPTAYAVYKRDKVAFSLGFGPNSGGGSADFGKGLPSFEKEISTLPYNLSDLSKLIYLEILDPATHDLSDASCIAVRFNCICHISIY